MKKIYLLFVIIFSISLNLKAQEDNQRRWLVLLTADEDHPQAEEQVDAILTHREAAIERKIAVVKITTDETKSIFNSPVAGFNFAKTFQNRATQDKAFEVLLIGLDGTIKLRKTSAIPVQELFDLIDSMPMRKAEMRNKK